MTTPKPIGIICAMEEEIRDILLLIESPKTIVRGSRTYRKGYYKSLPVVACLSGMGKVAAASAANIMIDHFNVEEILFTGVAGAIDPRLKVGDIVVATSLIQHDFDASPIQRFKRFEIPLTGKLYFDTDAALRALIVKSCTAYLNQQKSPASLYEGIIASGDQFISDASYGKSLMDLIPGLLAVEMEGAAVAQVCHDWNIPFAVIRSISDAADHNALVDFPQFIKEFAAPLSAGITKLILEQKNLD